MTAADLFEREKKNYMWQEAENNTKHTSHL